MSFSSRNLVQVVIFRCITTAKTKKDVDTQPNETHFMAAIKCHGLFLSYSTFIWTHIYLKHNPLFLFENIILVLELEAEIVGMK
jgi:hypothetical protein